MAEDTRRYYGMDLPRSKGPHPDPLTDAPTPPVGEERVSDERLAHLITAYGFDRTNREWHLILTELQERRRSPPAPGAEDLVERLRALARAEHDDLSVADEAADVLSQAGSAPGFKEGVAAAARVATGRWHVLKTWPDPFDAMVTGRKRFEFRKNDRGFQAGDMLELREFDPVNQTYTGRVATTTVTYLLLGGNYGIPLDYCVMSIGALQPEAQPAGGRADIQDALKAAEQFEFYEREHRNKAAALPGKATDDPAYLAAHAKADTNKRFAALCRSALPKEKET